MALLSVSEIMIEMISTFGFLERRKISDKNRNYNSFILSFSEQ